MKSPDTEMNRKQHFRLRSVWTMFLMRCYKAAFYSGKNGILRNTGVLTFGDHPVKDGPELTDRDFHVLEDTYLKSEFCVR